MSRVKESTNDEVEGVFQKLAPQGSHNFEHWNPISGLTSSDSSIRHHTYTSRETQRDDFNLTTCISYSCSQTVPPHPFVIAL